MKYEDIKLTTVPDKIVQKIPKKDSAFEDLVPLKEYRVLQEDESLGKRGSEKDPVFGMLLSLLLILLLVTLFHFALLFAFDMNRQITNMDFSESLNERSQGEFFGKLEPEIRL